ncbi:MAG: hypothetical protein LBV69_00790 [Bacteroidales bacterium]|jgi:hypothetical protein|nr:hypothetical protein [Bacteroidales bacterium]
MFSLYFEYPVYYLIIIAIVAAGISFLLYFRNKTFRTIEKWKIILLSVLRFVFSFLIISLLLKPVIKSSTIETQKPIIVLAQDNSKSIIINKDSIFYKTEYKKQIQNLISNLQNDYDVRFFKFSDKVENDTLVDFSGEQTNISNLFNEISSRFSGMNVGAILLATDGLFNAGQSPAYSLKNNYPIYSIALGDTISQKDLLIKDIIHNKIALLGNVFPIQVFISAENAKETESEIIIQKDGKNVYSSIFQLPKNSTIQKINIDLKADKLGLQQYKVILKPLKDEISLENNVSTFVINVIDDRKKILLLANAPHPDISAIKSAIKENPDFDVNVKYINSFRENINNFDLVILHQLPSNNNNLSKITAEIEKNKISVLYILGNNSSIATFNSINTGLQITKLSNNSDHVTPFLNTDFSTFSIDNNTDFFNNLSPIQVFFGNYKFNTNYKTLLYQKTNNIKTDKPLIAFLDDNNPKIGFIIGDGLWKWRIDDYKNNTEHTNFNILINRIIQYMSIKQIKDKLTVNSKQIFNKGEAVIINAEFYNETFEIVKNLDIVLSLKDIDNKEYKYNFESFQNSYRLNLGPLSAGKYNYSVSTKFDGKDYNTNGEFIVQKINLEHLVTTANHNLLYQIAENTNGKVFSKENFSEIEKTIKENKDVVTIQYKVDKLHTISDLYLIFFIILLFAVCEWSLRKYFGSY